MWEGGARYEGQKIGWAVWIALVLICIDDARLITVFEQAAVHWTCLLDFVSQYTGRLQELI